MNNNGNNRRRCGCMRMARGYWNNYPYYTGPCPDEDGCYRRDWDDDRDDDRDNDRDNDRCDRCDRCDRNDRHDRHDREDRRDNRRRCGRGRNGGRSSDIFTALPPVAISANGIVPLALNNPCRHSGFDVNSGLITLKASGTYLAIYTVQVPAAAALDTLITLNVDGASQSTAATQVTTAAGDTTSSFTGVAIFEANDGATVSMRTSEAINVTDPATQPIFTLSLVQLED